ncbi:DNA repair protein rad50 [Blomia tropicalis]|nr:DNA repair protein rad50 [Blomia tropicalis]
MLHLQRLIIQGIRSFNPDEPVDIKFSLLTIFHGPDDVGKTTIIDSLKYALTGNLPPNCDNEECFVHDVQYSKRSMICGQTRLIFIDTQNKSTEITRNLSLFSPKQNNQTTIRFIQDDAIISQDNNPIGVNNEALEFRSFEISRVVLDYIIFCHQEETNWPLSDGKVLKERFDDIFGYLKANLGLKKQEPISSFHKRKMEEINKLLKQFWQVANQEKDDDYIIIRSEEEERSASDKRRTYNYRVVMVRNGQEMDMKGRCSAGEKVLASLVIRLALAVIFGQNFPVIILDEPTTNLNDTANICSFGNAVISLIDHYKFQFIITSHDEEFIQFLEYGYFRQQHYKVFKNERGYSSLVHESIGNETEDTFPLCNQPIIDLKERINEEENSLESTTKRTKRN